MGRTCGEPNEIKKNTHPTNITALLCEQGYEMPTMPAAGAGASSTVRMGAGAGVPVLGEEATEPGRIADLVAAIAHNSEAVACESAVK